MTSILHILFVSLFPAGLILAALRDATSYTIPNWLSAALVVAVFPAAFVAGLAPPVLGVSLLLGVAALAAAMAMFAVNWIGGGDAKLFAASAVWLGWPALVAFLAWTALAGGALATLLLMLRRAPLPAVARGPAWVGRLLQPGGEVPYGVAIAIGALVAFPASPLFHALSTP